MLGSLVLAEMEGEGSTWMVKEFGVMHEEVSSSFMKQAQLYNALSNKVSSTKEGFDALCKANSERELKIRDREEQLAQKDVVVKRLRTEHASLEKNNQRMRDQEAQLEATRKEEHRKYIETLDKCTRQMYASRQASRDACKAPELARQPGEDSPASAGPPLQLHPWLSLAPCGSLAPVKATAHLPSSRWTRCASCSRASRTTWASGCLCPNPYGPVRICRRPGAGRGLAQGASPCRRPAGVLWRGAGSGLRSGGT